MMSRPCVAGTIAFFAVAALLAPNESFARSGSFGGRSLGTVLGTRPSVVRQFRALAQPHAPGSITRSEREGRGFESGERRRHAFGFGYPWFGPGLFYGPSYEPTDVGGYSAPGYDGFDGPVGPPPIPPFGPPFVYRVYHPGCASQAVSVPSEEGGETTINVVRC